MTAWKVTHEQWEAWADQLVIRTELDGELDAVDGQLLGRLHMHRFPTGDDETLVRGAPEGLLDEAETVIRAAPTAPEELSAAMSGSATVVREAPVAGELSVQLHGAESSELSVELVTPVDDSDDEPPEPSRGESEGGSDEMFIPVLTRSATVVAPAPEPAEPPPLPPPDLAPAETPPQSLSSADLPPPPPPGHYDADDDVAPEQVMAPAEAQRASGELVAPDDPGSSQTSGMIQAGDASVSGSTLTAGEIPDPVVRRSKIVVDPSASGVFETIEDAEELDESDLVEEAELVEAHEVEELPIVPPTAPPTAPPIAPEPPAAPPPMPPPVADAPARTGATLPPPPAGSAWVDAAFGEHSFALHAPMRPQQAAREVDFIVRSTGVPAGARAIDVGCGDGAHALALARHGINVTAFDASQAQVARARATADQLGAAVTVLQGDMREPPVSDPADLVMCVGSTLGLFDDETNSECVRQLGKLVRPGGHLVIQVFNRDRMVGRLPARSWWQGQGCLVLDEAKFDSLACRLQIHRTIVFEDGRQYDVRAEQRAYGAFELVTMCQQAGLVLVEASGSIHTPGTIYGAMSPDIWVVARKPAE
jgi:SAM-dependent methyltransferase